MNKTVVGIGEILWDVFPERKVLGGAPANFAYHVTQFGYDGVAVSAIGDDELGEEILSTLADKGLGHLISKTPFPTGTVQVTLDGAGIPSYNICEGVAWDNLPFGEKSRELAARTSAVCFGSLAQRSEVSRRSIRDFLGAMPEGSLKVFDINLRQHFYTRELILESLDMAGILKINDEELAIVSAMFGIEGSEQELCERLLREYRLDLVILTKGSAGSYVFSDGSASYLPTPQVQVADTVGAGDSFTAAFIASYMRGEPIARAHELAVRVSAYVCTRHGAMPPLPEYLTGSYRL